MKNLSKRTENTNIQKTRKQLRKQKRKEKKVRRNEYYTNRKKPGKYVLNPDIGVKHTVTATKNNTTEKEVHKKIYHCIS